MNQKQKTIYQIFEQQSISLLNEPSLCIPPQKIMHLHADSKTKEFERNQIIKQHNIFKNQLHHNYTTIYLDKVSELLFQNEEKYYIKRNQLKLPFLKHNCCCSNNIKQTFPCSVNKVAFHSTKRNKQMYYEKEIVKTISYSSLKERNRKLIDIVHLSNKMNNIYVNNFKNRLIRRIDGIKEVNLVKVIDTPRIIYKGKKRKI